MTGYRELNLDRETFLAQYWQSKPLLIKNAIRGFEPPLDKHELAGLALDEEVESRLIERRGDDWQLHHGPFEIDDFQRDTPWTLLVQAVDHYIPAVAELRKLIDFIPQWRIDDIMVSYAVDGGSVGPHYDNYDVFLLQGEGQRLWQLGQFCDATTVLRPHGELRILQSFEPKEEHLLSPGDMLYVPPGVAHWGIAKGDCTTFSIGFRAPRIKDMVSRWVDGLLEQLEPDQFYRDGRRAPMTRPGEIHSRDLERAVAQLQGALDQAQGNHWFGELVTEPRETLFEDAEDLQQARTLLHSRPRRITLSPQAKLAWLQEAEGIMVFANGTGRNFDESVLQSLLVLCDSWQLAGDDLDNALANPGTAALLDYLLDWEVIYVQ